MEFLNNYRQNRKASVLKGIKEEADRMYSVIEYDNSLYYAFNGVPMVGIPDDTPAKEILEKWQGFKKSYIDYKKEHNSSLNLAAAL